MDAYIFDAVRTPRGAGKDTGALHGVRPIELLGTLYKALVERNQFPTEEIEDVILGCVTQTAEQGANLAKISALYAGWSPSVSGMTVNRFCASGLEAVNLAAAKVMAGMSELVVAGGVESMSRVPMLSDGGAWYADADVAKKTGYVHMGVSADLIATLDGWTRADIDAYALRSQERAARAQENGRFSRSLVPVVDGGGKVLLAKDEIVRAQVTLEKLGALAPAFDKLGAAGADAIALSRYPQLKRIEHLHHAGCAPGIVDGASLLIVGSRDRGRELGLRPRARIRSFGTASVEPVIMLTAPAPATKKALNLAGLTTADVDLFEVNESFSSVVLHYQRELSVDPDWVNVNGGAIALGHPLGATGGMLLATLLDELERREQSIGVVAMCAGAGLASATVIERV